MEALLERAQQSIGLEADVVDKIRQGLFNGAAFEDAAMAAGVGEDALLDLLSRELGLERVDVSKTRPTRELLQSFPARLLVRHRLLPIEERAGAVIVATSHACDAGPLDELRLATGREVVGALAPAADIERELKQLLGVGADTLQSLVSSTSGIEVLDTEAEDDGNLDAAAHNASIITLVNQILTEAVDLRATDVHIEPFENQLRIRYRIDGVLQEAGVPPEVRRFQAAIVSRIKILSHLDIAEKRLPQDGRIRIKVTGREIDVRVSIIPMLHGEAVVLRVLQRNDALLGTEHLGMASRERDIFDRVLEFPHGIVLVTGPTGSGKTTTLYAALSKINDVERKIVTIEDPVEYQLRGVNQIQVSTRTGLTFALGLRSILRHDPDVILVGEIRDRETAEIAVQSSLTGHLVFSTLHTNDAPGAATRLIDMGVEPYLVASSLEVVVAQRLVRLICAACRAPLSEEETERLQRQFGSVVPATMYHGRGCRACLGTGYRGRAGIFELLEVTDEIREVILSRASSGAIRRVALEQGMNTLRDDGWRSVQEGRTTADEILRATKYDGPLSGKRGPTFAASASLEDRP